RQSPIESGLDKSSNSSSSMKGPYNYLKMKRLKAMGKLEEFHKQISSQATAHNNNRSTTEKQSNYQLLRDKGQRTNKLFTMSTKFTHSNMLSPTITTTKKLLCSTTSSNSSTRAIIYLQSTDDELLCFWYLFRPTENRKKMWVKTKTTRKLSC
ncbi:unnamed protein product, partial [Ceratitis capitata]